jgi:hypothetical protein
MAEELNEDKSRMDRRKALQFLGVAAASGLLTGCGGGSSTSTSTAGGTSSSASCAVTPEGEEGPYFVDDRASGYLRSDIRSNLDGSNAQAGVPLTLKIYVYDTENSCAVMSKRADRYLALQRGRGLFRGIGGVHFG